jgi:hypothetical protein
MVVLLVVVQMALWAHAAQVAQVAASEGDRAAVSLGGGSAAGVTRAHAVLSASGSDIDSSSVVAQVWPGDRISVTVTGRALSLLPWFVLPVSATQTEPIQEFRASG